MYKHITVTFDQQIASLCFNRPDQLNAMNRSMMDEIIAGIQEINESEKARVAVITGKGRAFMAGADIKEYATQTPEEFKSFQARGKKLYESIENAPIPWIAAVNGFALGGGFEIALSCDMIFASENAKLGLPEVFLNLVPGGGGTQRLIQRIGINRAKELLFTGSQYTAKQFFEWGMINHIFPNETFETEVYKYAAKMTRRPAAALKQLKSLAHLSLSSNSFDQRLKIEQQAVSDLFYSVETKKAIQDFIDKSK